MKKLIVLGVCVLLTGLVWATAPEGFNHTEGTYVRVACDTIDSLYTSYGSWERACSTGATFTPRDTGDLWVNLTGFALLRQGQKLYIGLDPSGDSSVSDTGYCHTYISAPEQCFEPKKMSFSLAYLCKVKDSGVAISAPVVTFGRNSVPGGVIVDNVVLTATVMGVKSN